MKDRVPQKLLMIFLLSLLSAQSFAFNFPEPCSFTKSSTLYSESSVFVTVPSNIGGCIGVPPGAIVGGIVGIPFGNPDIGIPLGAITFDYIFQGITGLPFYLIEYFPRNMIESLNEDSVEQNDV